MFESLRSFLADKANQEEFTNFLQQFQQHLKTKHQIKPLKMGKAVHAAAEVLGEPSWHHIASDIFRAKQKRLEHTRDRETNAQSDSWLKLSPEARLRPQFEIELNRGAGFVWVAANSPEDILEALGESSEELVANIRPFEDAPEDPGMTYYLGEPIYPMELADILSRLHHRRELTLLSESQEELLEISQHLHDLSIGIEGIRPVTTRGSKGDMAITFNIDPVRLRLLAEKTGHDLHPYDFNDVNFLNPRF